MTRMASGIWRETAYLVDIQNNVRHWSPSTILMISSSDNSSNFSQLTREGDDTSNAIVTCVPKQCAQSLTLEIKYFTNASAGK